MQGSKPRSVCVPVPPPAPTFDMSALACSPNTSGGTEEGSDSTYDRNLLHTQGSKGHGVGAANAIHPLCSCRVAVLIAVTAGMSASVGRACCSRSQRRL